MLECPVCEYQIEESATPTTHTVCPSCVNMIPTSEWKQVEGQSNISTGTLLPGFTFDEVRNLRFGKD